MASLGELRRPGASTAALLAGALALLAAACAEEPAGVAGPASPALFDPELVAADRGTPFVHFGGASGDSSSIELGLGWGQVAAGPGGEGLAAWIEGPEARFELPRPDSKLLELVGRCRPLTYRGAPAQGMVVEANGKELARLTLEPVWQTFRIPVARDDLLEGTNAFRLRFTHATRPSDVSDSADDRELAARFTWLGLVPAGVESPLRALKAARLDAEQGELRLPPGGAVEVPFPGPAIVTLALGEVRRAEPGIGLAIELLEPGGAVKKLHAGPTLEATGLTVRARVDEPGVARLRLLVSPGSGVPPSRAVFAVGLAPDYLRVEPLEHPARTRPDVFVYVIDTLRADAVSALGYERPTTPAIAAFLQDAVVYERAWSPAAWTLPATVSLLTGRDPRRHGVLTPAQRLEAPPGTTLAGRLGAAGYETVGLSHSFVAGPLFGVEAGFDEYHLRNELGGMSVASGAVRASLLRWLVARADPERPLFAYLHTVDPHAPYVATPELERVAGGVEPGALEARCYQPLRFEEQGYGDDPRELAWMRALYDGEVAHADREFGCFLEALRHLGLYDGSLIVLVSDHGEEFREHGAYDHGKSVHEEILHVPLAVKWPGGRFAGTRVTERVRTLDVTRTVLETCGLLADDLDGESLRPDAIAARSGPRIVVARAVSEGDDRSAPVDWLAVARGPWKAIWSGNGRDQLGREVPEVRVYDLEADPREDRPLPPDTPGALEVVRALEEERQGLAPDPSSEAGRADPSAREALRALGYVGD